MKISTQELKTKIVALLSQNYPKDEAENTADYLVWAEMAGIKTQGLVKLTGGAPIQSVTSTGEIVVEKETPVSQTINGGNHLSAHLATIASDVAIQKVRQSGIAIIGIHNAQNSNGAQAYYVEKIAREGFVAVMCTRSPASGAAFGGIDPVFGTNPIGFAFPTHDEPILFDMATTAMTWYGLVIASAKGEKIPDNTAIDKNGSLTNDPTEAMDGALLSFDRSYKGSGLGMMIELMAGPLVGADYVGDGEWGSMILAIDPNILTDGAIFKQKTTDLVKKLRAARTDKVQGEIRLPSDKLRENYVAAKLSGSVEIDDKIVEMLGFGS